MPLKLQFNLIDLLNSTEDSKKAKALTPFVRQEAVKQEFGNRVIDFIKDRTLGGRDKNDVRFTPYSKAYKQSRDFKIYGKSSVNLKLTGEMQASMGVKSLDGANVQINFVSKEQDDKARGHINGSGPLPVRDFWGIKKEDQVKILKSVIKDFNAREDADSLLEVVSQLPAIGAATGLETEEGVDIIQSVALSQIFGGQNGGQT